jgi:hypothetical protein
MHIIPPINKRISRGARIPTSGSRLGFRYGRYGKRGPVNRDSAPEYSFYGTIVIRKFATKGLSD